MTLRLALVIDGDAKGAKAALQDTKGAISDLKKEADGASASVERLEELPATLSGTAANSKQRALG